MLAHIDGNNYEIVAVQSNSGAFVPGEFFTLGNSFSRQVFERGEIVAATDITASSVPLHHPLYGALPLECFIGAPVLLDGNPWGVIDFSSMAQREQAFGAADFELVQSIADSISGILATAA